MLQDSDTDEEEHRENNYKTTLLSSLDNEVCHCVKNHILPFSFHGFGLSCYLPVSLCLRSKNGKILFVQWLP